MVKKEIKTYKLLNHNGNISELIHTTPYFKAGVYKIGLQWGQMFVYDQLNRLKESNFYHQQLWGLWEPTKQYNSIYYYDGNGNILTLFRNESFNNKSESMDYLTYHYQSGTNKLDHVTDGIPDYVFDHDIDSQLAGNYEYDATGNLIRDESEGLQIYWTPSGKISRIEKDDGDIIRYLYDHTGNRVMKRSSSFLGDETSATFYVNDAQGNIMATYSRKYDPFILNPPLNYYLEEQPIYGTGRLGVRSVTKYLVGQINQGPLGGSFIAYPSDYDGLTGRTIGLKQYELTDHLGNVRVIFGDRLAFTNVTNTVMPEILAVNSYYPFGMIIRSLSWQSDSYRWGFGGHEKDDEVKGTGNHLSFGGYGYDPRLGRRPRPDPVDQIGISNYAVFRNNPMLFVDPTGMIADGYTVDDRGYIEKISDEGGIKYDVLYKKETYSEAIRKDYDISGKKSGLRLNNTKVLPELLKTQKVTEAVAHDTETGEIEIETFDLSKYTTEAKISSEIKREMNRLFYFLANNSNKAEWQLYKSYKEEYGISTLHSLQDSPGTVHLGLKSNDIKMMIHSHPRPKTIEGAKSGLYFDIEAAKHIEKYFVYIPKLGIIFQISNTGELGKMQAP